LAIKTEGKEYYVGELARDMVISGKETVLSRANSIDRDRDDLSEEVSKVLLRTALVSIPLTLNTLENPAENIEIEKIVIGVPAIHFDERIVKTKYSKIFMEDDTSEKSNRIGYIPLKKNST